MNRIIPYLLVLPMLAGPACDKSDEAASASVTSAPSSAEAETSGGPEDGATSGEADVNGGRCEQAYRDLEALVAGLEEQLGSSDSELPERESFLASCESLPGEIQECMIFEYAMANQKECEARVDALDPDQRARAQELMGK